MAVFTEISQTDFTKILEIYDIGKFLSAEGIIEGVENTNYFLNTTQGKFIFTIYENRTDINDLPFFLNLMNQLNDMGFPCPIVIKNKKQNLTEIFKNKNYAIISLINGKSIKAPNINNIASSAQILANFHILTSKINNLSRENSLGLKFWIDTYNKVKNFAESKFPELKELTNQAFKLVTENYPTNLPKGIIHADFFPDNVMIDNNENISGVIDFYMACNDFFAYELAIMINAWCFEKDYSFNPEKEKIVLENYQTIRKLSSAEKNALPLLKVAGCLRFLVTRLHDNFLVSDNANVNKKPPEEYIEKLRFNLLQL